MSSPPAPRSIGPRVGSLIGGLVFVAIVGGYVAFDRLRAPAIDGIPLPGGKRPSGRCTIWFIGSSTVARWSTLAGDFAPWDARGRGADGALIPSIATRLSRDAMGPAPAAIVFYAGENDIAAGAGVGQALGDFDRFMALKTRRFAALPVIAVSLKPSPARQAQFEQQTAFNAGLATRARHRGDLRFLDIRPLMLASGQLGPFYAEDRLHLNATGYARWTAAIRPALAEAVPSATVRACLTGPEK